eukprot:4930900-Prymnesium_polylepis.1
MRGARLVVCIVGARSRTAREAQRNRAAAPRCAVGPGAWAWRGPVQAPTLHPQPQPYPPPEPSPVPSPHPNQANAQAVPRHTQL